MGYVPEKSRFLYPWCYKQHLGGKANVFTCGNLPWSVFCVPFTMLDTAVVFFILECTCVQGYIFVCVSELPCVYEDNEHWKEKLNFIILENCSLSTVFINLF